MSDNRQIVLIISGVSAAICALYVLYNPSSFFRKWLRNLRKPWVKIGQVSELFIHPVKGCRGMSVSEAECDVWGLRCGNTKDRHIVLINAQDGNYINAKHEPKLLLVQPSQLNGVLTLKAPGVESFSLDLTKVGNAPIKTAKYSGLFMSAKSGRPVDGRDCGDMIGQWFENFLDSKSQIRALFFVPGLNNQKPKEADQPWSGHIGKRNDKTPYAYNTPYMLISQNSIDDLNDKLGEDKKVSPRTFRANIVVSGCEPYDEDKWMEVKIGETKFTYVIPSTKCVITTINTKTAEMDKQSEPLKSLRKYRLCKEEDKKYFGYSPVFGAHLGIDSIGKISVGNDVYVRYRE